MNDERKKVVSEIALARAAGIWVWEVGDDIMEALAEEAVPAELAVNRAAC